MITEDLLFKVGEHDFTFEGQTGRLEGKCIVPERCQRHVFALLGHPHPLYGGTMSNKVVTTLARALTDTGILNVRFNFRGVGKSEGTHDDGVGESEDMAILLNQLRRFLPNASWVLGGFSFGSYVTYRVACAYPPKLLITIAPPVERYDYTKALNCPWVLIQGEQDEIVAPDKVYAFAVHHQPLLEVIRFKATGHFFHGQLLQLRSTITQILEDRSIL